MASSITKMKAIALGLLIILIPIVYLTILNQMIPHPGLKFYAGWNDNSFQTNMWKLSYSGPVDANISSENGILKVYANGKPPVYTIVTAQRWSGVDFDLTKYRYLEVSVMTSGLAVAARIVIWTDFTHGYVILLKTYNDNEWHTEAIDVIFYLGILGASSSQLYMIELGWQQAFEGSNSTVCYRQLSFNSLEAA